MGSGKACEDCGTTDGALLYRSGKMAKCVDCQHFANLKNKKTGGGLSFDRAAFVAWKRESPDRRICVYCGLTPGELYELDIVNPRTKRRYETLGVDRIDNSRPYDLDNLAPCCPLCNQIKSQLLTYGEMMSLGPHVRAIWVARLDRSRQGVVAAL